MEVVQACDLADLELLAARGDTRRAANGFGAPHRLPIADYTLHGWNVDIAGVVRLRQCFSPPGPRWVPGVTGGAGRLQSDYGADQCVVLLST